MCLRVCVIDVIRAHFFGILSQTVPILNEGYWKSSLEWSEGVALVIFVVDVIGVKPGYYLLFREPLPFDSTNPYYTSASHTWEKVTDLLDLYLVQESDQATMASLSQTYSARQAVALHCSFHMSMIVPLHKLVKKCNSPQMYRKLHWECGMIGALLYLEASSRGYGATGMGCFLDDIALQHFGYVNTDNQLQDEAIQPLYHFVVGVDSGVSRYPFYNYEKTMAQFIIDNLKDQEQRQKKRKANQ